MARLGLHCLSARNGTIGFGSGLLHSMYTLVILTFGLGECLCGVTPPMMRRWTRICVLAAVGIETSEDFLARSADVPVSDKPEKASCLATIAIAVERGMAD